jgi:hypothetical protein
VLVEFAGIDVGFAGVAGGVDQEVGPVAEQRGAQDVAIGVIDFGPAQVPKRNPFAREQRLIGVADVTGASEQVNHGSRRGKWSVIRETRRINEVLARKCSEPHRGAELHPPTACDVVRDPVAGGRIERWPDLAVQVVRRGIHRPAVEYAVVRVGEQLDVTKGFPADPISEVDEVEEQFDLDRLVDGSRWVMRRSSWLIQGWMKAFRGA